MYIRDDLMPVIAATPEQTTWDLPALRAGGDELLGGIEPDLGNARREVVSVPRAAGDGELELRWFIPPIAVRAVIVSIHGGGYVCGRAKFDDEKNAEMAQRLTTAVVSPDYRLAPEYPFPAGAHDCVLAIIHAQKKAQELGVPLVVFGDSAGGGLAYFSTLMYSERLQSERQRVHAGEQAGEQAETQTMQEGGHIPAEAARPISAVILLEPCLDPRTHTASFSTYADGPVWTKRAAVTAWQHTAPSSAACEDIIDMLENSARVKDFPSTLTIVNPADPLRDEGIALAAHLADSGVQSQLHMYAGTFHGALSVKGNAVWNDILALIGALIEGVL